MDKFSELKAALEFLETTEFYGEWDSALVGGEGGKNYHAVINANDEVVRAADDSRHASWLCDYLEAASPVKVRALLAELEAKDKRIAELERVVAAAKCDDELWDAMAHRLKTLEDKLAAPVRLKKVDSSNVPFAGDGFNAAVDYCAEAIRAAGFKCVGDE